MILQVSKVATSRPIFWGVLYTAIGSETSAQKWGGANVLALCCTPRTKANSEKNNTRSEPSDNSHHISALRIKLGSVLLATLLPMAQSIKQLH